MPTALSFAWNHEGLGHVSRLIAVHTQLRARGWRSVFVVEEWQKMLNDYSFEQIVIPEYSGSLLGDDWWRADLDEGCLERRELCLSLLNAMFAGIEPDLVVHDVVVHEGVHQAASRLGVAQHLILRARRGVEDPVDWIRKHEMDIQVVYRIGQTGSEVRGGICLVGVDDIVRERLDSRSPWPDDVLGLRIAITAGGGGHAGTGRFVDAALLAVAEFLHREPQEATVLLLPGPFFHERANIPADLRADLIYTSYLDPHYDFQGTSDVVIAQGGYNTFHELRQCGTPAVVAAAPRALDDQAARIGDGSHSIISADIDGPSIAAALSRCLVAGPVGEPPASSEAEGAVQAAEFIDRSYHGTAIEPPEYQAGTTRFCGLDFTVNAKVIIPRAKTELLVERVSAVVAEQLAERETVSLVDVGTGSGACLLSVLSRLGEAGARVEAHGVDISAEALEVARLNAERILPGRAIAWYSADLYPEELASADVLMVNLPYLPAGSIVPATTRAEPAVAVFDEPGRIARRLFDRIAAAPTKPYALLVEYDPEYIAELESQARKVLLCQTRLHCGADGLNRVLEVWCSR